MEKIMILDKMKAAEMKMQKIDLIIKDMEHDYFEEAKIDIKLKSSAFKRHTEKSETLKVDSTLFQEFLDDEKAAAEADYKKALDKLNSML